MEQGDELHLDDDPVTEAFFSAPPPPVEILAHEWDPPAPLAREHLRAMRATGVILAGSLLGLGAFLVHQKLIMPTPVELGAAVPEIHWTIEAAPALAHAALPGPAVDARGASISPSVVPLVSALSQPVAVAAPLAEPAAATPVAVRPRVARESASARAPRTPHATGRQPAGALQKAHAALRAGNARLARGHAVDALALDPSQADAYIVLGAARAALGDASGAQQAYRLCAERAAGSRASACRALVR